jgi:hypothetical protein
MSTLLAPRRPAPGGGRRRPRPAEARQESLFGALPAAPPRPERVPPEPAEPETAAAPATAPAEDATVVAPAKAATIAAPAEVEIAAPAPPATPAAAAETADLAASQAARAHRQGPTLDDLVVGAWEGLLTGAPATCPVCESTLAPRYSAGAGVVGGRCGGCGSTLG